LLLSQSDARFALRNLSGDRLELLPIKDVGRLPVHHLYQRRSRRLDKGESVCFVNVFDAWREGEEAFTASLCGERRAAIRARGRSVLLGAGPLVTRNARIKTQAWLADSNAIRLVSASQCAVDGRAVWRSDEPRAVRIMGAGLGDRVTSLAPVTLEGKAALVAASESGHVWALGVKGERYWCTTLGEPVRRPIPSGDTFVCAALNAGVVVLSRTGDVVNVAATPAPAMDVVFVRDQCVVQLADGSVCGVPLQQQ
jgi:hypothetical protein